MKEVNPDYAIPVAKFTNSRIVLYYAFFNGARKENTTSFKKGEVIDNRTKGEMSYNVKKRISNIIYCWIGAVETYITHRQGDRKLFKQYMTFATLTISDDQKHSDYWIKRNMLNKFLIYMKRKTGLNNYLWIAEKQQNGRIHFHLILDRFVKWQMVREVWNDIQKSAGYLDDYYSKHNHYNPNSTDIREITDRSHLDYYFRKEFTKQIQKANLVGRMWGSSDQLKNLVPYSTEVDGELTSLIADLSKNEEFQAYEHDYFKVITGEYYKVMNKTLGWHSREIKKHYMGMFKYLYAT